MGKSLIRDCGPLLEPFTCWLYREQVKGVLPAVGQTAQVSVSLMETMQHELMELCHLEHLGEQPLMTAVKF